MLIYNMSEKQCNYKVVLLGDPSVGKSCLASRFVSDTFCEFQESTIGAAFMTKTLDIGSYKIRFEIWDTAGQERYRSLAPLYYRGAMVAIVIFDITKLNSFEGAKKWVYEIKQNGREDCIIILVGNKIDLEHLRNVENDIIYEYIEEQNIMYFDTSAKSGKNIVHMFEVIGKKLPRDARYHSRNIKIARAKSASSYRTYYCC
jgi:small GTP-binding protein